MKKLLNKTEDLLTNIVGEDVANKILSNMFPPPIKGYKKGKVLTVGELKLLPDNTIIHLHYLDEDNRLRKNDFVILYGYDGDDELCTTDGFNIPIDGLKDEEFLENIQNCDWTYTVCEAIKK